MRTLIYSFVCSLALAGPAQCQLVARFRHDNTGAGQAAVRLARRALDTYCRTRRRLSPPHDLPPLLHERSGVFVSAMKNGAPRCCMGSLYSRGPNLAADIISAACRAAAYDIRFPPLRPAELPHLRVIVSIVDPPQPISNPWLLNPVEDGLAVRSATRTGVVLPGETDQIDRFVSWARIRAAAAPGEPVTYLRLNAVRFIEPEPKREKDSGGPTK